MLKLLCCYGRGVSENFKDANVSYVDPNQNEKAVIVVTTDTSSENGAPTKTEYFKAFGMGFLETLDAVSKFAPKPVPDIVHLGVALIKAFDRAGETLESAKSLRARIEILIAILIDEVPKDENGMAEIPQRLLKDILQFQRDLTSIISKLNAIEEQRQPLLLVFQSLNEQKIQECVDCLAASLNQFQLSGQIGNTYAVEDLKKRLTGFLEKMNNTLERVESTLNRIDKRLDATQRWQSLPQRPDIPCPPRVFYGRDSDVAEAAEALTQPKRKHLALLGQGGIGKTTAAIAVLHHTRIQQHFTKKVGEIIVSDKRVWVSCTGVNTVEKFEHALLTAVAGAQESPNARQTAINELKNLEGPILVILDNFETPWDAPTVGIEVESILRSLDALPQLSIFVTMRAGEPPCVDLDWDVQSVNAVDDGAAKSIYLELRHGPLESSAQEDDAMTELLRMVGNHPLAIILLAASARKKKATVSDVLSQYKSLGTSMLGPSGKDQYHNMNICVQVSIDRLTGDFRDASVHLLARLSMLPAGATTASFWLEDLKDTISPALDLLLDTALVQTLQSESGLQRYTTHPVIRDYILDDRRRPSDVLLRLLERAHAFLETNKYNIGDAGFKERAAIIRTEEMNLQAVLLIPSTGDIDNGLVDSDALLNSLLLLAKHHAWTSPRLEVAEKAVSFATSANKPLLQAEAQFALGKNLHALDRYQDAKKCFESAREFFRGEPAGESVSRAADCLLETVYELGYITTGSFKQKMDIIDEVLAEYRSVSDNIGVGRCFRERSCVFSQNCRMSEALEAINEACKLLVDSPYDLGLCYYHQSHANFCIRNFEEGDRCGKLGIELLGKFGSSADQARHFSWMGEGHNEWGHYESAVDIFNNAIDRYTECGLLLGLAQSWIGMSLALMKMGKVDLAEKSIDEARKFSFLAPDGELKDICVVACLDHDKKLASIVKSNRDFGL